MQNNPFADLIPSGASRLPPLRQIVPPQPKQPPAQTPAQRRKDEADAAVAGATREDRIRMARAERVQAERTASQPSPEEIKRRGDNRSQVQDLRMVAEQLNRVQQLYAKDLRGTGVGSVAEYLPTPKMQRFEAQAKALAVLMKPMIRTPGEGPWTDKDQALLDRLVPTRFTSDKDNEERLLAAKRFIMSKVSKHGGEARLVPTESKRLPEGWSIEEEEE
jgi:hypothetical protein